MSRPGEARRRDAVAAQALLQKAKDGIDKFCPINSFSTQTDINELATSTNNMENSLFSKLLL